MPTVSIKTNTKTHKTVYSVSPDVGKFFQLSYDGEVYVGIRLSGVANYFIVGKPFLYELKSSFITEGLFLGYLEQGDSFTVVI